MMRYLGFLVCFFLFTSKVLSQDMYLNLGYRECGVSIGNSGKFNGFRINAFDENVFRINGVNIIIAGINPFYGYPRTATVNGLNIGVLMIYDKRSNGISIAGLGSRIDSINGVAIAPLFVSGEKINGLVIAGIGTFGVDLNGIFVAGVSVGFWPKGIINKVNRIRGITLATMGVSAHSLDGLSMVIVKNEIDKLNGVCFGIYNKVRELHGVQIGFWNHADNNRVNLPFLNLNFRCKTNT